MPQSEQDPKPVPTLETDSRRERQIGLPRRGLLTRAAAAAAARAWFAPLDLGGRPRRFLGASCGSCSVCQAHISSTYSPLPLSLSDHHKNAGS